MEENSQKTVLKMLSETLERVSKLELAVEKLNKKKPTAIKKPSPAVKPKAAPSSEPSPVARIRSAFLEAYEQKFGHAYHWGAKESGMANQWLKTVPLNKALEYCHIYPAWKIKGVIEAGHPFWMLVTKTPQLVAHIHRYPQLVADIVHARARENVEINSQIKDAEVLAHAQRYKDSSDQQLLEPGKDKVQIPADNGIPGPLLKLVGE